MDYHKIYRGGKTWLDYLLVFVFRLLLGLRYRVRFVGLDKILAKGTSKILFLPNHVALMDPLLLGGAMYRYFHPRTIADANNISAPFINWASQRLGARPIPDLTIEGPKAKAILDSILQDTINGLKNGENLLMFPGGRLKRQHREIIGATSGAEFITKSVPDIRVVLIRHNGLWGSSFSWGLGTKPSLLRSLWNGIKILLANFIFFCPKRIVNVEFFEPEDFPKTSERLVINRYLEEFYNADNQENTKVRYYFWQSPHTTSLPEPKQEILQGDISNVPETTKKLVLDYLAKVTGISNLKPEQKLTYDLGMDSIKIAEIIFWLEREFGFTQGNTDAYQTVLDVMLAATGKTLSTVQFVLKPIGKTWWARANNKQRIDYTKINPNSITQAFLYQAKLYPDQVIVADQQSGEKTYRQLITAIFALLPHISALPGERLGIMLPASVASVVFYLTTLFAGKTPVMVNWTTGAKNMLFSLQNIGVQKVITAHKLILKLKEQGMDLSLLENYFAFAEEIGPKISFFQKLCSAFKARFSWRSLEKANIQHTAVILFTSGSENNPKSVPLSHQNILSDIRDLLQVHSLYQNDVVLGILPPFHSFGLVTTIILPLVIAIRAVYYPNPTEAKAIANIIEAYQATIVLGTPTFLQSILRAAHIKQTQSMRMIVTGAEKCPEHVYQLVKNMCPNGKIVEGYGITECSPVVSITDYEKPAPGTIGKILPSLRYCRIDVDTEEIVGIGKIGKLLVAGPSIFSGYLNYDGKSPFIEKDGVSWYNTGDLVIEDENHVLTFAGRLKRFIKLGGEMISLPAIEEILKNKLVNINEEKPRLAVESTDDESNPEIVLFSTLKIDRAQANEILRSAGLSPLNFIRRVEELEEIPLLGTGKTDYRGLKRILKTA